MRFRSPRGRRRASAKAASRAAWDEQQAMLYRVRMDRELARLDEASRDAHRTLDEALRRNEP